MNDIWFTSDTHFRHANIIKYCNRPFASPDEMDEKIIENWNKVVKPGDRVYHLGDFGWGDVDDLLKIYNRLRGQKYFIIGNHDKESLDLPWIWQKDIFNLRYLETSYFLAHYAHRVWNKSFHGARHVFGHTHGMAKPWGWSCDVGVDSWEYAPVNIDTLEKLFAKLPRYVEEEANAATTDNSYGGDRKDTILNRHQIWQGRECMLTFKDAFFGDGTYDKVDPDELAKKNPDEFKKEL
jgi:calcineurin-like phosphoesterase family protein